MCLSTMVEVFENANENNQESNFVSDCDAAELHEAAGDGVVGQKLFYHLS